MGGPLRIIGLLSWYDEDPQLLKECVAGAAMLCDYIVAVDGAYAHFPGADEKPYSDEEQHDAIVQTAKAYGKGVTTWRRVKPWESEVQKRNAILTQIAGIAEPRPGDWLLRFDADEVLTQTGYGTRDLLENTPHDVAEVILWDSRYGGGTPLRALYRNVPGLRIEQAHYLVKAYDNTVLNGPNAVEAEQLWDIRLNHRTHERTPERLTLKAQYNKLIPDLEKVECP